jgi:hypothetical protein
MRSGGYSHDDETGVPYLEEHADVEYWSRRAVGWRPEVDDDEWCGEFKPRPDDSRKLSDMPLEQLKSMYVSTSALGWSADAVAAFREELVRRGELIS